jgi:gluconolactonase
MNSPNDVLFKSDGSMYFTDPPYGFGSRMPIRPRDGLLAYSLKDLLLTLLREMTGPTACLHTRWKYDRRQF